MIRSVFCLVASALVVGHNRCEHHSVLAIEEVVRRRMSASSAMIATGVDPKIQIGSFTFDVHVLTPPIGVPRSVYEELRRRVYSSYTALQVFAQGEGFRPGLQQVAVMALSC